jgi:hypothetical protein
MPKTAHREEIEIKLRVPDVAALRRQLKRLRAQESRRALMNPTHCMTRPKVISGAAAS